jgi:hypothetical protein
MAEFNFNDVKVWWQSNTVRGGFLALGSLLLNVLFKDQVPVTAEALYENILNLLTAVGTVWAFVGRLTANTKLVASSAEVTAYRAAKLNRPVA